MKISSFNNQSGFTLIEMIVSLALFSVVVTTSVGALLALISTNQQLQVEQSIMTNLSFALDSMTREIRTGTAYFCETANNYSSSHAGSIDNIFYDGGPLGTGATDLDSEIDSQTRNCPDGRDPDSHRLHGLSFIEAGDSITQGRERILYFYDTDEDDGDGKIYRRVGNGRAQSIVSSGVYIENLEFFVTGTDRASADDIEQPTVTILIEARERDGEADVDPYYIQTTVTQRTLDI